MPRAAAARDVDARQPTWLTDAVGGVWNEAEWARWERRALPALEARGVTVEMLQPVYGAGDGELLGIGVQTEAGWHVGWLGQPRRRRAALLRAAGDLVRSLDLRTGDVRRAGPDAPRFGAWFRSR